MAKITVCDKCKKDHNKITETRRYASVRNHPELRLDLCLGCSSEINAHFHGVTPAYVQEVFRIKGMNMDLEQAKMLLQRR